MSGYPFAQMLHGYTDGHREIARWGVVDERDAAMIDRLSDLSGYVPTKMSWEMYLSGYPLRGRSGFAISATWPDVKAKRSGCVLTHTLLFDFDEAIAMSLGELTSMLRKPSSAEDVKPYRTDPTYRNEISFGESFQKEMGRIFHALNNTNAEDSVVWIGPDNYDRESLAARVWRWSSPTERASLSFCTMALGERSAWGRDFRLLLAPYSASIRFDSKNHVRIYASEI